MAKNKGGHLLGRSFQARVQLFGHGYASGQGSLIRGGVKVLPLYYIVITWKGLKSELLDILD